MACTYQATMGGKFAPLIRLKVKDMDINTMITTYNTLVESLDKTCSMYKMVIGAENAKLMTNNANDIQKEMIKVKGQKLGCVISFEYFGAIVSDDGAYPEISQGLHKPLQLLQS